MMFTRKPHSAFCWKTVSNEQVKWERMKLRDFWLLPCFSCGLHFCGLLRGVGWWLVCILTTNLHRVSSQKSENHKNKFILVFGYFIIHSMWRWRYKSKHSETRFMCSRLVIMYYTWGFYILYGLQYELFFFFYLTLFSGRYPL